MIKSGVTPILDPNNPNIRYPLDIRRFACGQYLSHIAYYLAKQPQLPDRIHVLSEDGYSREYWIKALSLKKGLVGYILLPLDKNCLDVKVIWRGTDPSDPDSVKINIEEGGPALHSFYQEKENIFQQFFDAIYSYYPEKPNLTVDIAGHSQGGAMSQLFATQLLIERHHSHDFDHLSKLNMTALSSPGVAPAIASLANEYAIKQQNEKSLTIIANFGSVKGDIVPTLGLDTIFATLNPEVALVNVLKISNEFEEYWKQGVYWKDGIQLTEMMSIVKNTVAGLLGAHSANSYFAPVDEMGKITVDAQYELLTNKKPEDRPKIEAELLLNKTRKLQMTLYLLQKIAKDLDVVGLTELSSCILHYFNRPKAAAPTFIMNAQQVLQEKKHQAP